MKIEYVIIFIITIFAAIIITYRIQNMPPMVNEKLAVSVNKSGKLIKLTLDNYFDKDIMTYNPSGIKIYVDNSLVNINTEPKVISFKVNGNGKKDILVTSVAASNDNIFIADAGNAEVLIFNYKGKLINNINKSTKNDSIGFIVPSPYFDIAWDNSKEQLYIANPGCHRVEIYDVNGKFLSEWGNFGGKESDFTGCCNPADLAVYKDYIVTAEKGSKRVRLFSKDGKYFSTIADAESFPVMDTTIDLLTTTDGKLLLKDRKTNAIYYYSEK
ncbi:MAG: hypothetical protein WCO98_14025 [bacterium]